MRRCKAAKTPRWERTPNAVAAVAFPWLGQFGFDPHVHVAGFIGHRPSEDVVVTAVAEGNVYFRLIAIAPQLMARFMLMNATVATLAGCRSAIAQPLASSMMMVARPK